VARRRRSEGAARPRGRPLDARRAARRPPRGLGGVRRGRAARTLRRPRAEARRTAASVRTASLTRPSRVRSGRHFRAGTWARRLLWVARRTGMLAWTGKRGGRAAVVARIAPNPRWRPWSATVSRVLPATSARRGAVALLPGCVMDQGFPAVHEASAKLLRRAGF